MRTKAFSFRVFKEMLREPLTLIFGLGFPLILLALLSMIQANIPVELFEISSLAPGVTVFGLSFMTLFTAQIISRDRETAYISRLYTTPMKSRDFLLGYMLPMLPISLMQSVICYLFAFILGLEITLNVLLAIVALVPVSLLFISIGLLAGTTLSSKAVGGICGALLTNLSAWVSGIWFDVSLVGGVFETIANLLPFIHSVELVRGVIAGNFAHALPHLIWVIGYGVVLLSLSIWLFFKQMKKN